MTIKSSPQLPQLVANVAFGALLLYGQTAFGQVGVAPSQTGLFFDDLRSRAMQYQQSTVDESNATSSAGVYDYSRGEYTGESVEERPLGERAGLADAYGREMGYPGSRSGYAPTSRRSASDYAGTYGAYSSASTFFAPTYITDPFLAGKRNIKVGPVNIGLGMNANVEYNDNVTRSNDEKIEDIIAGIYFNVDANYQITENNRLNLAIAFGFDHYFDHPELSSSGDDFSLNVLPGSSLSFDIRVGDILFVLYDRLSVRPVSQDEFALDDFEVFGALQNDLGVGMSWALNSKLNLSLNVNRSDEFALEDAYQSYDRVVHSFSGSLGWTPTGTFTIGVEGSFSIIDYDQEFNNDGTTTSGGLFVIVPITKNTWLKASGGVQSFDFDSPPTFSRSVSDADLVNTQAQITAVDTQIANLSRQTTATPAEAEQQAAALQEQRQQLSDQLAAQTIQKQQDDTDENSRSYDNEDLSDYYYNVTLFSQINSRFSHQLTFGHESSLNTTSNFITADYVTYGIGIIAWRGSRLSLSGYYEEASESGGRLAEDTEQFGFDAFLSHRLTDHVTLGLGYHYGDTDSSLVDRDYVQHAFTVDLNYAFTQKMNVGLGYRYLTTDAEDPTESFDQNRVILTVNYNF
jgi:hypothetical protein